MAGEALRELGAVFAALSPDAAEPAISDSEVTGVPYCNLGRSA